MSLLLVTEHSGTMEGWVLFTSLFYGQSINASPFRALFPPPFSREFYIAISGSPVINGRGFIYNAVSALTQISIL